MFLDSHCHIFDDSFDGDRDQIIQRAEEAGLRYLLTMGTSPEEMEKSLKLAEINAKVFVAAGLHPHEAEDFSEELFQLFLKGYSHPKMAAVGEIGLDFWYDNSPRDKQEEVFRRFLRLALEINKPVIIHLRDPQHGPASATAAYHRIMDEEDPGKKLKGIIHCFSHSHQFALDNIERGFLISFPGIITFPKASELREVARMIPAENILVETDCPYLAPIPYRGKRNEPAYVVETARTVADVRGISFESLDQIVTTNFEKLFCIKAV